MGCGTSAHSTQHRPQPSATRVSYMHCTAESRLWVESLLHLIASSSQFCKLCSLNASTQFQLSNFVDKLFAKPANSSGILFFGSLFFIVAWFKITPHAFLSVYDNITHPITLATSTSTISHLYWASSYRLSFFTACLLLPSCSVGELSSRKPWSHITWDFGFDMFSTTLYNVLASGCTVSLLLRALAASSSVLACTIVCTSVCVSQIHHTSLGLD